MMRDDANKAVALKWSWRNLARFGVAAVLLAMSHISLHAETPVQQPDAAQTPNLTVPTTKILAIGSFTEKATMPLRMKILPSEVRETVRLYLDGKIDQWFVKQDLNGVVFLMNVTDVQEAHALLEKLPFGQAGAMEFQLIPLGPISPLRLLLAEPGK